MQAELKEAPAGATGPAQPATSAMKNLRVLPASAAIGFSTVTLIGSAGSGSFEEFLAEYDPSHANDRSSSGLPLLQTAAGNTDPGARCAIMEQLLNDGADPSGSARSGLNCLHVLFGAREHDFPTESRLLRELLDRGADINAVAPKFGTPLQTLMDNFAYSDEEFAPLYDVVFSRDDLDLLKVGAYDMSTLQAARSAARHRRNLLDRMLAYLDDRGIEAPAAKA